MTFSPVWTAELNQTVSQPPAVVGDLLVVPTQPSGMAALHGVITAVSLTDGTIKWRHSLEYSLVSGLVAHQWQGQDVVIVTGSSSDFMNGKGNLFALNTAGEEVWRWESKDEHFSAPFMLEDTAVVVVGGKTLLLAGFDGSEQRISLSVQASMSAPLVLNDIVYVSSRSPNLLAINLQGEKQWQYTCDGEKNNWLDKTPIVIEERVIATSSRGSIYVVEQATGKLVWRDELGEGRNASPPATDGENIFVGCKTGVLALDVDNGRVMWRFDTPRPVSAQPLVLRDHVLFNSEDHNLYVVDKDSGTEQWQYELPRRIEMPPLLTETAVLVVDRGGNVVALERPSDLVDEPAAAPIVDPAIIREMRWQAAQDFEREDNFLAAAELWREMGELERAAVQYEAGEAWLIAAKLWRQLDRYGKRADALKRHAQNMSRGDASDEEKALAWENATRIFAEMGEKEERVAGEREVARYRRLPILAAEIRPEPMVKNAWAKVEYTIRNVGFGTAQYMTVQLKDDRFEGQVSVTQNMVTLAAGRDSRGRLDVRPRDQGSSVPMRISIEFMDKSGLQQVEKIFYLPVSGEITQVMTQAANTSFGSTGSREALAELPTPEGVDLFSLRNKLMQYFSREELSDVVFELGISEDNFSDRLPVMARELITALARIGRIEDLIAICERERSHVSWRD